jgi:hypothetical protein
MSATWFTLESSHPVRVEASDDDAIILINEGDTVYYGQTSLVSATNKDGQLTNGQSITLTIPTYLRSASSSLILILDPSAEPDQLVLPSTGHFDQFSVGYNPSVDLFPDNSSKWAALTFKIVTDKGGGNRVHAPAYNAVGIDVPEFVFRRFGPQNTAPWGPNADGTGLAGLTSSQGIGRLAWQPAVPTTQEVTFAGLAASISATAAQDARSETLSATLTSQVIFGPSTPATITLNQDLDAIVTDQGDTMAWKEAGTFTTGGVTVTYSARSHTGAPTKCYGCTAPGTKTAKVTIDPAGDNNTLKWTAATSGAAGNNISIEYRNPGLPNQAFLAEAVGNAVIIHLETDSGGGIVTSAAQINSGIDSVPAVRALVVASNKITGSTGEGVVPAVPQTFLAGGADTTTVAAGAQANQVRVLSGGDLTLRATSIDASDNQTDRVQITQSGLVRVGLQAMADQTTEFFAIEGGPARIKSMPTPAVTATVIGTPGTTTITYNVIGNTPGGGQSLPGTVTVTNAPNTLDDTNHVKLSWGAGIGYQTFDVIRVSTNGSPSATGPIVYGQPAYNRLEAVDHGQAPAGLNEVQTIQVLYSDGGTFTLTNPTTAATSAPMAWNISPAAFKTAWEAVSGIGSGNTTVVQTDDPLVKGVNGFRITYGSGLASTDVAQPVPDATSLTQSDDFIADYIFDHGTAPPAPTMSIRTRVAGGPISYPIPTRNTTSDLTVDGRLNLGGAASLVEMASDPAAPDATHGLVYAKDSGGRTKAYIRDSTGVKTFIDSSDNPYVPGGTDVAVADGGTGASTAAAARTNLDVAQSSDVDARYRRISHVVARATSGNVSAAAVYSVLPDGVISGQAAANAPHGWVLLNAADYAVTGRTTKLRLVVGCVVNDTAPGNTMTFGLYPVGTPSGGAGITNPNFGTVVSGSTCAFATPAANSKSSAVASTDFTFPTDGWYAIGVDASAAIAANSQPQYVLRLEVRNV